MHRVLAAAVTIALLLPATASMAQSGKPAPPTTAAPQPQMSASAPSGAPGRPAAPAQTVATPAAGSQLIPGAQPPTPMNPAPAAEVPQNQLWQPPAEPTVPADVVGLCQCLYSASTRPDAPEMTRLNLTCVAGEGQCKAACGNRPTYSFVPAATFSCPVPPKQEVGPVALNTR